MEMTAVWKERKSKRSFPLFPHRLRKLANNRELPTFPQLRRRLGFLYLQARLTSTLTKSVTYMPGTFCYRHARSHHRAKHSPMQTAYQIVVLLSRIALEVKIGASLSSLYGRLKSCP